MRPPDQRHCIVITGERTKMSRESGRRHSRRHSLFRIELRYFAPWRHLYQLEVPDQHLASASFPPLDTHAARCLGLVSPGRGLGREDTEERGSRILTAGYADCFRWSSGITAERKQGRQDEGTQGCRATGTRDSGIDFLDSSSQYPRRQEEGKSRMEGQQERNSPHCGTAPPQ